MAKTTWTHEAFEAYVQKLEPEAQRNPSGYRQKVLGWIVLGYAYIALLFVGTLALLALLALFFISGGFSGALLKLGILLLIFAFTLLRSLWVKVSAPEGLTLTPKDAPPLFAMVERLRERTGAPPFAKLLLTTDFNAMAAQVPRLGILGWPKNYLIVGLPLMQALSPEEFESVIAHELGHLRSGHAHFGSRVYRIFATWARLAESGGGLLAGFANWYFPRLNAYTFPLRRQDEYEADRIAAEAVGARVAADALCGLHVRTQTLKVGFWDTLSTRLLKEPEAPRHVFVEMGRVLRQETPAPEVEAKGLRDALLSDTTYDDSHPALKDRLAALAQEPRIPERPLVSAAEAFFGENLARTTESLDALWFQEHAESWKQGHEKAEKARGEHEALAAKRAEGAPLTDKEAYDYASGVEHFESEEAALPLYEALLGSEEVGDYARFDVGRIRIERDEPEGAALLEAVVQKRPAFAGHALPLLQAYHKRQGDEAAAQAIHTETLRHADRVLEAQEEASQLTQSDRFIAHTLSTEEVDKLRVTLAGFDELGQAFLVEKQLQHFAQDRKFVILAIALKKKFRTNEEKDYKALWEAVNGAVPMVVVPLYGSYKWFRGLVEQVPGACIYEVSRETTREVGAS